MINSKPRCNTGDCGVVGVGVIRSEEMWGNFGPNMLSFDINGSWIHSLNGSGLVLVRSNGIELETMMGLDLGLGVGNVMISIHILTMLIKIDLVQIIITTTALIQHGMIYHRCCGGGIEGMDEFWVQKWTWGLRWVKNPLPNPILSWCFLKPSQINNDNGK